ncbi:hypothetical protein VTL71DRAFT_1861 [Oculimacula yallundae]|uniref:Uncharacterized protein n=1 Tax=Oculimacula yallundae TaxID=86028 RepID=A0ABR4CBW1_9HELO
MSAAVRPKRHTSRTMALFLGLTVLGLYVFLSHVQSGGGWHHSSPSPSVVTVVRVPYSHQQVDNAIALDPGMASDGTGKMYVDRVHPRQFARAEIGSGTAAQAASFAAEVERIKHEGGKILGASGKKCARGKIVCDKWHLENDQDYHGHYEWLDLQELEEEYRRKKLGFVPIVEEEEDYDEDDEDYDWKLRSRSPLKWTTHQGPPNKHSPPKAATVTTRNLSPPNYRDSHKGYRSEVVKASTGPVEKSVSRDSHSGTSKHLASHEPKKQATSSQQSNPKVVEQSSDKNPHTSMNLGIPRPKPSTNTHTSVVNTDPSKATTTALLSKDIRQAGDREALLVHSESTSNQNSRTQRGIVSAFASKDKVELHHSELVPRRLICDCGPRICDNYPTLCSRWIQVPDRKRSDSDSTSFSSPEPDHARGDDNATIDQSSTMPNEEIGSPQQDPASPTLVPTTTDSASTDPMTTDPMATNSTTTESTSGEKHYIPPYWRNNGLEDPTTAPNSSDISQGEITPQHGKQVPNSRNGTKTKSKHTHGPTVADLLVPKKCNGTTNAQQHQCETTHVSGIILYTILGVFFACIVLLAVFKCCVCLRRRRNIVEAKKRKSQSFEKSGISSLGDSLSSRPENTAAGIVNIRPIANMDGADDSWSTREHRRTWNFFSRNRGVPGRYSPVPQMRAPRIPTLKLPKPVFATVRKVSGLGFEGITVMYKKSFNKGKKPDINRVKWTSTV